LEKGPKVYLVNGDLGSLRYLMDPIPGFWTGWWSFCPNIIILF